MSPRIIQAQLLIERHRPVEAENVLRQELAENPQNAFAHSLLALSLSMQKKYAEATTEARIGTRLAPTSGYGYHILSLILFRAGEIDLAQGAIQEAIRLNPEEARYYETLGQLYLNKEDWQNALKYADEGLRIDALNVECANIRAIALIHLGRREEAARTIDTTLERAPEDARTHANQGWALLHRNQPQQAMHHFQEALRLQPDMHWAQQGIVEALKARNPIYRVMLGYFLWMSRLTPQQRWGVVIGLFIGAQVVRTLQEAHPQLTPILTPITWLYIIFVFLAWTSQPLFDLLLRFNRLGRLALSPKKIVASNWMAVVLLIAAGMLILSLLPANITIRGPLQGAALKTLVMILPVAGIFYSDSPRNRNILLVYTLVLTVVLILSFITSLHPMPFDDTSDQFDLYFWFGWVGYTWLATYLLSRR